MKIESNKKISKSIREFRPHDANLLESNKDVLPEDYFEFYQESDGFKMEWQADQSTDQVGRIRIQKLQYFLSGLKSEDALLEEGDELYSFHPIDLLSDEAVCGIFIRDAQIEDKIYFHMRGEEEVFDLELTFKSYLTLANETKGYFYWQKYLMEIISGEKSPESDNFKKNMPLIFPDFSLESFTEKFENMRLK